MTYFFIINPGSRQNRGALFIPHLLTELNKQKISYEYRLTNSFDDAYQFSRYANESGYEVIVAIGGDGTINKVVNGFYNERGKRISKTKLGVIHTGTSPDFCKSYGIPTNPHLALETLLEGFVKEISVARIEYQTHSGESRTGYYTCCASFGIGAQVALVSNSGIRKYVGDVLGTFISILFCLCRYKPSNLSLICDDKKLIKSQNFNTFIGLTTFIASGMKVAHNLKFDDKRLYVLSMMNFSLLNIIPAIKTIYSGKPFANKDYVSFEYANSVYIMYDKVNNQIEFDGDPQGYLPCRISIATEKLELITNEL